MTSRMRGKEFGVRSRKNTAERGSMRGERNREAEKMGREDAVGHATHIKTSRHQDSRHQDIKTPFQVMHIGFYPREGRCRVPGMTMALIWMFSIVRDKSDELFRDDRLVGAAGTAVGSQGGMLLIDFGDGEDAVALGYCRQLK